MSIAWDEVNFKRTLIKEVDSLVKEGIITIEEAEYARDKLKQEIRDAIATYLPPP